MSHAAWTTLRRGIAAAAALLALASAAPAAAQRAAGGFFPAKPADGPSPDIVGRPQLSIARDGSGALAYVRRDGGEEHVFLSILVGGVPQAPARIDPGLPAVIGTPVVAASDGGRVVVVFADGAGLFSVIRPDGTQPFSALQPLANPPAQDPSVSMSINGVAYAAWAQGGDVRAAWLPRLQTAFQAYPGPLDADGADDAGSGPALRPQVATSSDGTGVAVWGEHEGATTRVVARRLVRGAPSAIAIDATAASLDGHAGGAADTPDVSIEDDSSFAWVVFREAFDDGSGGTVVRAVARRLRGSAFDDPVGVDGQPPFGAVGTPRVGINGRGQGMTTVEVPGGVPVASVIQADVPTSPRQLGAANGVVSQPVVAVGENFDGIAAWLGAPSPGAPAAAHAATLEDDISLTQAPPLGPDTTLSDPALGPVDPDAGLAADVDRAGDAAIAFVQAGADGRRLMVATYDRLPGAPTLNTTTNWRRTARPTLSWSPAFDVWGGLTYQVLVDGQPAGTTTGSTLTLSTPIADGLHRWQVVVTDPQGQSTRSLSRNLRIDATPPVLTVRVSGVRQPGRRLIFAARATDLGPPPGSGVRQIRIDFRDGTVPSVVLGNSFSFVHAFRAGTFNVRVSATDVAGNATVVYRQVTIKKPKKKKKKAKP